jgi:predicted amidophosphoribosyltransferase
MQAIADPPAYQRARAAVRFDEISRALVHALKYGDRLDLAPMMGRWLGQAGRDLLVDADACSPRDQPSKAVPRRCCAPAPPTSMCWCLPGLPTRYEHPYKECRI